MKFKTVDARPDFPKSEEKILKFWKKNKIFEKSVEQRPINNLYSFYDGPPFVTGVPHYGSLLSSIAKDVVPRYWTMKGKRVSRVWGWDCHGLPIENKVEVKLGLKRRQEIEKIGVKKFIVECLNYVSTTSPEWEWYIDRIGRWVDFKNAYRTMDKNYMETVIWVFKQIYDKGLIYQGKRVSLFCPHCSTPVSNFEIAMDNSYIDISEPSNIYKYQLQNEKKTFILAWSTTPWNKIVTPALAVNPKLTYVKIKQRDEYYILAKSTLKVIKGDYKIIDSFKGSRLERVQFVPHYDFYKVKDNENSYRIYSANFVTAEEGTGVVTIAAYGEDDFKLMNEKGVPILEHVDEEGFLKKEIIPWAGEYYLKVNPKVNQDLEKRGLLYSKENYSHSVPVCWRCKTRLIFAPQNAWFLAVSKLKNKMLKTNENINWVPKHFKHGRFKKGIENAPDWCISRSRYWGSPMPVWDCQCGQRYVVGSIKELEELSGQKITDLHRPAIDSVTIVCQKCRHRAKRVKEVLDCWVESGSMPYAQLHYPFENKKEFKLSFPADYIAEYVAQTRAWFYVMHVISNALFESHSFKNVIVTGVIMGTDGRKMSKSYGNYPDPKKAILAHGGDSLRLYLMESHLMMARDINIAEEGMKEAVKNIMLPIWNIYRYFISYANIHLFSKKQKVNTNNILDKWMLARLKNFVNEMIQLMDSYEVTLATRLIRPFINDVSTWYIRRSRERFVKGDKNSLAVLNKVIKTLILLMAPIAPFLTEEIFLNLKGNDEKESVHLSDYPKKARINKKETILLKDMDLARTICSLGNSIRKDKKIKLRQPLSSCLVKNSPKRLSQEVINLIQEELNVKQVKLSLGKGNLKVQLDTTITLALKKEGEAREIIRQIQEARKKAGLKIADRVSVSLPSWPKEYEKEIKVKTLAKQLTLGPSFSLKKADS